MIMWDTVKFAQNVSKFTENAGKFPKMLVTFWTKKKKNLNKMNNDHMGPII